jgi:3-dehydroquinate synthetase
MFEAAGLPTELELSKAQRPKLLAAMQLDKKVSDGNIKFVLARKIGRAEFGCEVPAAILGDILRPS